MADKLPALRDAFADASPLHQMFIDTLDELGGLDFMVGWAEENPNQFMEILIRLAPPVSSPTGSSAGGQVVNLNLHPGLAPGPLDGVVSEQ